MCPPKCPTYSLEKIKNKTKQSKAKRSWDEQKELMCVETRYVIYKQEWKHQAVMEK